MSYHKYTVQAGEHEIVEWYDVFYLNESDCEAMNERDDWDGYTPGYYFAFGFPGCMHDSAPFGPYATVEDAHQGVEDWMNDGW